jgi:hypothetical protein
VVRLQLPEFTPIFVKAVAAIYIRIGGILAKTFGPSTEDIMCFRASLLTIGVMLVVLSIGALADETLPNATSDRTILHARLIAPGRPPFHLKAIIVDYGDPNFRADVEIFWVAPHKWRRTIQSSEFSQTSIVNGDKVFEEDSDDYFPLLLQTFTRAMFNPQPLPAALTSENWLETRAPGHPIIWGAYKNFGGRPVARVVTGSSLEARVVELSELKKPDLSMFAIEQPTPKEKQIHPVFLSEADLRIAADQALDIIWPQPLDGPVTGPSSYYVSIDRTGQVREIVPLQTANERANDPALRQIKKWKFKPAIKDGVPVQAESVLTFTTNTRAYGPPEPLREAEVRKLASNMVEPVFPPGAASGGTCAQRIAIDDEGNLIEAIEEPGTPDLGMACYDAIKKWHFAPVMENGKPMPYRGEITFTVP